MKKKKRKLPPLKPKNTSSNDESYDPKLVFRKKRGLSRHQELVDKTKESSSSWLQQNDCDYPSTKVTVGDNELQHQTYELFGFHRSYGLERNMEEKQQDLLLQRKSTYVPIPGGNICGWLLRNEIKPGKHNWTPWYFVLDSKIKIFAMYKNQYESSGATSLFRTKNSCVQLIASQRIGDITVYPFCLRLIEMNINKEFTLTLGTTNVETTTSWVKALRRCYWKRERKRKIPEMLLHSTPWIRAPPTISKNISWSVIEKGNKLDQYRKDCEQNLAETDIADQNTLSKKQRSRKRHKGCVKLTQRPMSRNKDLGNYDLLKACGIRYLVLQQPDSSYEWEMVLARSDEYASTKIQATIRRGIQRRKFLLQRDAYREKLMREQNLLNFSPHFRRLKLYAPKLLNKVSIRIQRFSRGYMTRVYAQQRLQAVKSIQRRYRIKLSLYHFAANQIQRIARGFLGRKLSRKRRSALFACAVWWQKSFLAKSLVNRNCSAIVLQKLMRGIFLRRCLELAHHGFVILQSLVRRSIIKRHFESIKKSAIVIQSWFRCKRAKASYAAYLRASRLVLHRIKSKLLKKRFQQLKYFAAILASKYKSRKYRLAFLKYKISTIKIQAWYRGIIYRKYFVMLKDRAIKVQSCYRMYTEREKFGILKRNAPILQCFGRYAATRLLFLRKRVSACVLFRFSLRQVITRRKVLDLRRIILCQSVYRMRACLKRFIYLRANALTACIGCQALFRGGWHREGVRQKLYKSIIHPYVHQEEDGTYPVIRTVNRIGFSHAFTCLKRSKAGHWSFKTILVSKNKVSTLVSSLDLPLSYIQCYVARKHGARKIQSVISYIISQQLLQPEASRKLHTSLKSKDLFRKAVDRASILCWKNVVCDVVMNTTRRSENIVKMLSDSIIGTKKQPDFLKHLKSKKVNTFSDITLNLKILFQIWRHLGNFRTALAVGGGRTSLAAKVFVRKMHQIDFISDEDAPVIDSVCMSAFFLRRVVLFLRYLTWIAGSYISLKPDTMFSFSTTIFLAQRIEDIIFNFFLRKPCFYYIQHSTELPKLKRLFLVELLDKNESLLSSSYITKQFHTYRIFIKASTDEKKTSLSDRISLILDQIDSHLETVKEQASALGNDNYVCVQELAELKTQEKHICHVARNALDTVEILDLSKRTLVDCCFVDWVKTRAKVVERESKYTSEKISLLDARYRSAIIKKGALETEYQNLRTAQQFLVNARDCINYIFEAMNSEGTFSSEHGILKVSRVCIESLQHLNPVITQEIAAYAGRRKFYKQSNLSNEHFEEEVPLKDLGYIDAKRLKERLQHRINHSISILSAWNNNVFEQEISIFNGFVNKCEQAFERTRCIFKRIENIWTEHEKFDDEFASGVIEATNRYNSETLKLQIEVKALLVPLQKAMENPENFWWYKYIGDSLPCSSSYKSYRAFLSGIFKRGYESDLNDLDTEVKSVNLETISLYSSTASLESVSLVSESLSESRQSFDSIEDPLDVINQIKASAGIAMSTETESEKQSQVSVKIPKPWVLDVFRVLKSKAIASRVNSDIETPVVEVNVDIQENSAKKIQGCYRRFLIAKNIKRREDYTKARIHFSVSRIQALYRRISTLKSMNKLLTESYDMIIDDELKIPYYYNLNNGYATWDEPRLFSRFYVNLEPSQKGMYKRRKVMEIIRPPIDDI